MEAVLGVLCTAQGRLKETETSHSICEDVGPKSVAALGSSPVLVLYHSV